MSAITGRHTCMLRLREGGNRVGLLDWMDENPNDGSPWIGLVMIHADHQRRGLAAETIGGLAEHGRAAGWTRLREGVIEGNEAGMALALGVGMREVERSPTVSRPVTASWRSWSSVCGLRAPPGRPPDRRR